MEPVFVVLASITFLQRTGALFHINPPNLAPIDEGDSMTINCIVSPEYSHVEWWKEQVKLSRNSELYFPDVYHVTYSSTSGLHKYTLTVQSVTKESKGMFKCKAFRAGFASRSNVKRIRITVKYKPQSKYPLCEFNSTGEFAVCVSEKGNPLYELRWQRRTCASQSSVAIDSDYHGEDEYINKRTVQLTNFPTPSRDDDTLICVFIDETNRNCTLNYEEVYNTLDPPSISPNITVSVGQDAIVICTTTTTSINATINFNYSSFPRQVLLDKVQSVNSLQFIRLPQGITRVDVSCHLRWGPFDTIRSNVSSIRVVDDGESIFPKWSIPTDLAKRILTPPNNSPLASPSALITTNLGDAPADSTSPSPSSTVTTDSLHPTAFPTASPPSIPHATTPINDVLGLFTTDLSFTDYHEVVALSSESFDATLPPAISMRTRSKRNTDVRKASTGTYQSSFFTTMPTKSTVPDVRYETSAKLSVAAYSPKTVSSPPSIGTSKISQLPTSPTTVLPTKQSIGTSDSDPHITPRNESFRDEHRSTQDISTKSVSGTDKAVILSTEVKTILTTEFGTYMGSENDPTSFPNDNWTRQVNLSHTTLSLATQSKTSSESSDTSLSVLKDDSQTTIQPLLTSTHDELKTTESVQTKLTSEIAGIMKTASSSSDTPPNIKSEGTGFTLLSTARTTPFVSTYHSDIVGDTEITTPLKSESASSGSREPTDYPITPSELTKTTITPLTITSRSLQTSLKSGLEPTLLLNEPASLTREYRTTMASIHTTTLLSSTSMEGQSSVKTLAITLDQADLASTSKSQQSVTTTFPTMESSTVFPTKTSLKTLKTTVKHSTFTTSAFPVEFTSKPSFINSTTITSKTQQLDDTLSKETTTSSTDNTGEDEHMGASHTPSSPPDKLRVELWLLILLIVAGILIIFVTWYVIWFVIRRKCTQYGQYKVVTKPIWVNSSPGTIGLHEIHL
ncbi:hypothetical protein HOLleu_38889 [Holothuria leucospilota]|uniref:Ig-like domain-containing protein n=1 Tax=Holothuria leucospilota TaxID=206669 RepID=A0A9Q0YHV9_HOLLE|nr:hypothetical protein HOLleu_38889 [Holothuria leucospilota]